MNLRAVRAAVQAARNRAELAEREVEAAERLLRLALDVIAIRVFLDEDTPDTTGFEDDLGPVPEVPTDEEL